MRSLLFSIIIVSCLSFQTGAQLRLPSIISSGMVLQQNDSANLWGWGNPAERILVTTSWNGKTDTATVNNRANWKIKVKTPVAGGPYTITLKGNNTIVLNDIMIGEVWVCSGQSNMEWSYWNGLKDIKDELPACYNDNIRFFHIPKTTANHPQDDVKAEWKVCDSNSLKSFSAVGYYFGKKLQDSLHVPIGLINASWSGTPAETWAPVAVTESDEALKKAAATLTQTKWWPITPGAAYNGMIAPITNFAIAGAIWYQGEGNAIIHPTYQLLFTGLIDAWRKAWKKDFPFYYVQIAPYTYGKDNISAFLREQQTRSMSFPNTGMVVITDLVEDVNNIHPKNKKDVGARLANWALAETYHHTGFAYKSPVFKNMIIKNGKAEIYFDNAPNGFMIKGDKATEWAIAAADRNFQPAEVKIEKNRVIVFNKNIRGPLAVRFAFSDTAIGNIFSKEGLPVNPFRTDNW